MRDVAIIGIGQTRVGEHWEKDLRHLALEALQAAMRDAEVERVDALYVGNMLSGELTGQEHLGALVADFAGLRGVEAVKVEAACGSGAAAAPAGLRRRRRRPGGRRPGRRRGEDDRRHGPGGDRRAGHRRGRRPRGGPRPHLRRPQRC